MSLDIPFASAEEYRKQFSAAAERNKQPILDALTEQVPKGKRKLLEIASGVGIHVAFFAERIPNWTFQPTDVDSVHIELIAQTTKHLKNVLTPLVLDITKEVWPVSKEDNFDTVLTSNLLHVCGWEASIGLFHGCSRILPCDSLLMIYGPFKKGGTFNAESNKTFDEFLKSRNPKFGLKDIDDLETLAKGCGVCGCL
eukprot:jgi/Galph1/2880/GphlegSOOS_G1538.1